MSAPCQLLIRIFALALCTGAALGGRIDFDPENGKDTVFPSALQDMFPKCDTFEFVGSGGFGRVWLVKVEVSGQMEERAIKVFFHDQHYITAAYLQSFPSLPIYLKSLVGAARRECSTLKNLHESDVNSTGSEHIMRCHRSNIDQVMSGTVISSMPMFLELSSAGTQDLYAFMNEHRSQWSVAVVMKIYGQLLEALSFLSRNPSKLVHHDLKGENIMVQWKNGEPWATMIDFGAALEGSQKNVCHDPCFGSQDAAPKEAGLALWECGLQARCFATCRNMFGYDLCPQKYDMFGISLILLEMLTRRYRVTTDVVFNRGVFLRNEFSFIREAWDYDAVDTLVGGDDFIEILRKRSRRGSPVSEVKDFEPYEAFVKKAALGLLSAAHKRPSAYDLLADLTSIPQLQ